MCVVGGVWRVGNHDLPCPAANTHKHTHTRSHLGDQTVQVGVGRALDVEVAAAHVVEGLVVHACVWTGGGG